VHTSGKWQISHLDIYPKYWFSIKLGITQGGAYLNGSAWDKQETIGYSECLNTCHCKAAGDQVQKRKLH
jgi:hypothetical protein